MSRHEGAVHAKERNSRSRSSARRQRRQQSAQPLDFLPGGFAPFTPGVAVGGQGTAGGRVLLWRPNSRWRRSGKCRSTSWTCGAAGLTVRVRDRPRSGAIFSSWTPIVKKYPNAGWREGVDLKFIEEDRTSQHDPAHRLRRANPRRYLRFRAQRTCSCWKVRSISRRLEARPPR